jgi:hypothetical protein
VKGIAAVIAAGNEGKAHGYFSLHGLEPDTDYRVVGSRKPCSQPHTAAARMFSHDLRTAEGQTHLNISFNYKKTTGEYAVRSVRVLTRLPGGQPTQVACGITASYTDAGRVTY